MLGIPSCVIYVRVQHIHQLAITCNGENSRHETLEVQHSAAVGCKNWRRPRAIPTNEYCGPQDGVRKFGPSRGVGSSRQTLSTVHTRHAVHCRVSCPAFVALYATAPPWAASYCPPHTFPAHDPCRERRMCFVLCSAARLRVCPTRISMWDEFQLADITNTRAAVVILQGALFRAFSGTSHVSQIRP